MKVYCVWAWDQYYPAGKNGNLKGMYTNRDEAEKRVAQLDTGTYDYVEMTCEYVEVDDEAKEEMHDTW